MVIDNNLVSGGFEPCDCGLYDREGNDIHQNIAQASIQRLRRGRKFNQKNTCLTCNTTWLDFKDNYAAVCKCGSKKILGEKYDPEAQLRKVINAKYDNVSFDNFNTTIPAKSIPKRITHDQVYNNSKKQQTQWDLMKTIRQLRREWGR